MLFKGRLRLPNDPGEGIPIDLELEDVFLSLESGGEDFGEWRLDTVEIKRLFSNQFALRLDGEEMVFIADDALGFAYEGLTAVDDVKSRLSKRRIFKGRKPKKKDAAGTEPDPEEIAESEEIPARAVEPDVPMPEVVPFFPEPSPSFADSVAESATVDENIAPVAPRPIEIAEVEPEPKFEAPTTNDDREPEVEQPTPSFETARRVDPPTAPGPALEPVEDDDELVIEEVAAYGYVPMASASVEQRPEAVQPDPVDEDVDEASPALGAIPDEVHPLGDPVSPATGDAHHSGELEVPDPPTGDPEPVARDPEPVSADPEPVTHRAPAAEAEVVPSAETAPVPGGGAPMPPNGDSSFFAQWSSNGRAEADPELEPESGPDEDSNGRTAPQTQKSGRHARSASKSRPSRFGRKKSREPEAHEHRYESSKTVGGITRRVCAICGHVSFAGEDVYQDW